MTYHRSAVSVLFIVLGLTAVFSFTAGAASVTSIADLPTGNSLVAGLGASNVMQMEVVSNLFRDVKQNTGPVDASDLLELLETSFDDVDTDDDGFVSFAEASAELPGLTQAVFDEVDTDGDGLISPSEAGIDDDGCNCNGIDWTDPGAIIIAILSLIGLIIAYLSSGCAPCNR